ncbi:hypothetical protein [Yersinia hibernica]|uniref:hypothetical protein n=1 Tax=Yersinia hibernica TaxID=2339259 RepID=UPI00042E24F5|nr:hypothetical protein [Yersinia hibernica]
MFEPRDDLATTLGIDLSTLAGIATFCQRTLYLITTAARFCELFAIMVLLISLCSMSDAMNSKPVLCEVARILLCIRP